MKMNVGLDVKSVAVSLACLDSFRFVEVEGSTLPASATFSTEKLEDLEKGVRNSKS